MKKTLIALAALASTAAFAQSSVTISGRIDLGHANIKTTDSTGTVTDTDKLSSLAGDQQGRTTSRLTFSGVEDLGGGLKASFNYETRLNPDNTAAAGLDRTRNMFLNLSGGFGSVTIGTFLNSVDALRGYSASTYSAPGGDFLANHTGFAATGTPAVNNGGSLPGTLGVNGVDSLIGSRSTNSIAYRSPSFGGVVVAVGLTNQSQVISNASGTTSQLKTSGNSLAATYTAGPLSVHGVVANAKATGATAQGMSVQNTRKSSLNGVAVSYDLGMAKPYFVLENGKNTPNTAASATNDKYSAWELGSTFPMGAFTPYVTIGQGKVKNNVTGSTVVLTSKTRAFQVGTTYALSKRTYVYGAVGQDKFTETTAGVPAAQIDSMKRSGYKLGLVHQF